MIGWWSLSGKGDNDLDEYDTGKEISIILQSVRWWIFCIGIPHTTWCIHVLGSCSHQSI
jgi:hypothetical protein